MSKRLKQTSGPKIGSIARMIKNLPKLSNVAANTGSKKNAEMMKKIMVEGVHKRGWLHPALKPATIIRKRMMKYPYVHQILLATGDGPGTMIGTLQVRQMKKKNGYRMAPEGIHRNSKLPAQTIWSIHENGATISRGGSTWHIPARHPFKQAMRDFKSLKMDKASSVEARKAIKSAINKELRKS